MDDVTSVDQELDDIELSYDMDTEKQEMKKTMNNKSQSQKRPGVGGKCNHTLIPRNYQHLGRWDALLSWAYTLYHWVNRFSDTNPCV